MSSSSGGSSGTTISLTEVPTSATTIITRPQEPPPPTPTTHDGQQERQGHSVEAGDTSPQVVHRNHRSPPDDGSPVIGKRNSTVMMISNEVKNGGRSAGIDNPGFEEEERPATVGNGDGIFISVTSPSNGNASFLNCSAVDTTMLTERKDKEVAEAVNLELVNMNPLENAEKNGGSGIPVKTDGEPADYSDPYDDYFVPVNEHRKYMRGEKLYVTKDKRRSQSWRRCICWGIGFVLLAVAILIAVLAGTGVILSQESQTLVSEKTETSRQLGSSGNDGPRAGGSLDRAGGRSEMPPPEVSSFTPPPPLQPSAPSMPTTDLSQLYVPRVLEGELVIDSLEFNPGLSVSGSEEFRELSATVEEELKKALFDAQTLKYGAADIFVKVVGFSPGSVVVKFRIGWEFKEGIRKAPDPIDKDAVRQRLERQLNLHRDSLGTYHIPTGSVRASRLLDTCQFNNGECSHDCSFDYRQKMTFVCTCPAGLYLDSSGRNCTDTVPVEMEESPTHSHEPAPEPVPEPSPEPSPEPLPEPSPEPEPVTEAAEPAKTSAASTTPPSSYDMGHEIGPLPEHTTFQSHHSSSWHPNYMPEVATDLPSSTEHNFNHGYHEHGHDHDIGEHVPVTTVVGPSESENVSVSQAPDIAPEYEFARTSLPQYERENDLLKFQSAERNSTVMPEIPHKHFQDVPASVQVIYDDMTHPEHTTYSPVGDHELHGEELGPTPSPHFHKETQTLVVSVAEGNSSHVTEIPHKLSPHEHFMTEFPDELVTRHTIYKSDVTVSSQSPGSLTPHDHNIIDSSTDHSGMFSPSNEVHDDTGGIITTDMPAMSDHKEHHTVIPFGEHAENEAEPTDYPFDMEKKGGVAHIAYENRTKELKNSTSKKLGTEEPSENSSEEPPFIYHDIKMENEAEASSSKSPATDVPVGIVQVNDADHNDSLRAGHADMLTPSTESTVEMMHGSHDGMASIPLTEVPDSKEHRHAGLLYNDVYFSDLGHTENDTLNALSPEDYESRPLQAVTVAPKPAQNATGVHNTDLKKGPRLDDEMFHVNSNEEPYHAVTGDPTGESVPLVVHDSESVAVSSAIPVTERSPEQVGTSEKERFPSVFNDNLHPNFISATEVPEHGNETFEAANKTEDESVVTGILHGRKGNITETAAGETTLKPDKNDLSQLMKESNNQDLPDDMLSGAVSQGASEGTVIVTTTEISIPGLKESVDLFGTEITDMKPDQVTTDSTVQDVEVTTLLESDSFMASKSNFTSSILVHDSSNSSESNISSSSGENTIEEGELLHPGLFTTTTEHEIFHALTVAPLLEHHDNETGLPRNLYEDTGTNTGLRNNGTVVDLEQSVEITTKMESVDTTTRGMFNNAENSSASPADSLTTQSVVHISTADNSSTLLSESSPEPNDITTAHPHEENYIFSADTNGKKQKIEAGITEMPENKKPENEVLTITVQNLTQSREMNMSAVPKDSATTTDSTDETEKDDAVNNITMSEKTSPPLIQVSSGEGGISSTSPDMLLHHQEVTMNKTEEMVITANRTTETPLESDNEAKDADLHLFSKLEEHINTVRPLLHNVSSTQSDHKAITESIVLGSAGSLVTGVIDHSSTAFEKPHEFTDIENKLLVEPSNVPDVSVSSTTEYANEIHALPPSGGGNIIPPTAQSAVPLDSISGEIQSPTPVGELKNESLTVTINEVPSAVEHNQNEENSTTTKLDKDELAVSISKPESKKKDLLSSSINKKPLKSLGETSSLHGENDQFIPDKSAINLYEKKPVEKLQKFDKDSSKKIDRMGFAALVVGEHVFDVAENVTVTTPGTASSARTAAVTLVRENSTTETEDTGSRPVDDEDENEDPLTDIRGDIDHVNVVEPHNVVTKEKKSDLGGSNRYRFEGETATNESITVADYQQVSPRNDIVGKTDNATYKVKNHTESSIAVGIEPAISRGANETSHVTETPLTHTELPFIEGHAPQSTSNVSESSNVTASEAELSATALLTDGPLLNSDNQRATQKILDGNVNGKDDVAFVFTSEIPFPPSMTSESSTLTSDSVGNSSVMNLSLGIVVAKPQEVGDPDAPSTELPSELPTNITVETSSKSPGIHVSTVVTLSDYFATLHRGTSTLLETGFAPNSTKYFDVTTVREDMSPVGRNDSVVRWWSSGNGTSLGGFGVGETPVVFSKCASGQFQCVNGTSHEGAYCVSQVAKCDSVNDCSDGSDEVGCVEEGCPGNFQCSSGQCLKRHLVCNGIVDCNDGSDEVNCERWQCQFDEFQCSSGRCIPFLWHCDGKPDCDNHTDEYNCMSSCGNDEYLCPERWCIPMTWRCNGIAECANGEDEKLCDCSLDQFQCNTGGCVPKTQVCDGVEHCPDMSDEWGCVRLHNDTMKLQIRVAEGTWHPVCGDNWSSKWSDLACQSLGYSKSTFTDYPAMSGNVGEYYTLKPGAVAPSGSASSRLSSSLQKSGSDSTCISGSMVEVLCQEFTCGSHGLADGVAARLVGGDGATNRQWPSVALLYHTRHRSSCTASIISPKWLLSSYNCLHLRDKTLTPDSWVAFGGGSMFETDKPETQIREVRSIIPYPQVKYNQFLYNNDIALIELSQPLIFTRSVGPICLPEKEIEPRQLCVTAGWGYTSPGEINFSQYLHYLPLPTIDLRDCNSTKHYAGFITKDEICAGFTDAEKSPCYNDEGAPLMCVSEGGVWELQGVLSYHSNCGQGYHPSIFSSITAVRAWVEKTVGSRFERKSTFNVRRRRELEMLFLN